MAIVNDHTSKIWKPLSKILRETARLKVTQTKEGHGNEDEELEEATRSHLEIEVEHCLEAPLYRSTAQTPIWHLEGHPQRLESAIFWSQQSGCRSPSTDILISYCASSIQRVYSCLQLMGDTMHVSGLRFSVTVKGNN